MKINFNARNSNPSLYAISPESIQPQISPGSIQPQPGIPFYPPQYPPYPPQYPSYPPQYPPYSPQYPPYPPQYPSYPPQYPSYPPQYPPYPPQPPFLPPSVGGCNQKWARVRLSDGRTLNIYITSISEKSIGGFLRNGRQIALDLDEIVELTC